MEIGRMSQSYIFGCECIKLSYNEETDEHYCACGTIYAPEEVGECPGCDGPVHIENAGQYYKYCSKECLDTHEEEIEEMEKELDNESEEE